MGEKFGVVIVGAGPAGLAAGAQAARQGLSHLLLDSARLAQTVYRYQRGKFVMAEPTTLPLHEAHPVRFQAGSREDVLAAWEEDVTAAGTSVRFGPECEVVRVDGSSGDFLLHLKSGETVACERIVLAIGLQGNIRRFGRAGDDLPHVTYQLDDPAEHEAETILVIGAGDAGIENALALAEYENDVTMVNRGDGFPTAKDANRKLIESAIEGEAIGYFKNSEVDHFEPRAVVLRTPEGPVRMEVDLVIGRLGAFPPRTFLESLGVRFRSADRNSVPELSERYESNVAGIHIIGALTGEPLIKQCMNQGYEVVEYLRGKPVVRADEPILERVLRPLGGSVNQAIERIRGSVPLFAGLSTIQMREFIRESAVERHDSGSEIFRYNEFSDEFYAILDGSVEAAIPASEEDRALDRTTPPKTIPVRLGRGEFFGEMSLISGRRRNATVLAGPECFVLKIPRLAMTRLLNSSKDVRQALDAAFVARSLANLSPEIDNGIAKEIARSAEPRTLKPGETLFEQDAEFDGAYLVCRGTVVVSHKHKNGHETVLTLVKAGAFVGTDAAFQPDRRRSAKVHAAVRTHVVRISPEDFLRLRGSSSGLEQRLNKSTTDHISENVRRSESSGAMDFAGFIAQAASDSVDLLLIDESLCVHCDNCEKACAETHDGISRLDREQGSLFVAEAIRVPTTCRHCENPSCMTDCPPDAIYRKPTGEVAIRDNCIGCGNCERNCPYGVIQMATPRRPSLLLQLLRGTWSSYRGRKKPPEKEVAVKCDLCASLPIKEYGTHCVSACPTGAVIRMPARELERRVQAMEG